MQGTFHDNYYKYNEPEITGSCVTCTVAKDDVIFMLRIYHHKRFAVALR
mgnify:CR=1 FL=1